MWREALFLRWPSCGTAGEDFTGQARKLGHWRQRRRQRARKLDWPAGWPSGSPGWRWRRSESMKRGRRPLRPRAGAHRSCRCRRCASAYRSGAGRANNAAGVQFNSQFCIDDSRARPDRESASSSELDDGLSGPRAARGRQDGVCRRSRLGRRAESRPAACPSSRLGGGGWQFGPATRLAARN